MGEKNSGDDTDKESVTSSQVFVEPELVPGAYLTVRFGDWELHLDSHELHRGSTVQTLEKKQLAVLLELVRRAPYITSHDDLLETVWCGVIVSENTIHQAIASLRRVFGDKARTPQYIATVARQGYRWVGPAAELVHSDRKAGALNDTSPEDSIPLATWGLTARLATALCVIVILGVAALVWWDRRAPDPTELIHFGNRPLWIAPFVASSTVTLAAANLAERRLSLLSEFLEIGSLNLTDESSNAQFHIRGFVEQDGERTFTRLNVSDYKSKQQLWTHRFKDTPGDNAFTQAPLAATLVAQVANWFALESELLARDFADPVAVRAFTQGQIEWHAYVLGVGGNPTVAFSHLQESLRLQPDFWLAQIQLSILYANRLGPEATYAQHRQRTFTAIERLLALRRLHGDYAATMIWQGAVALASQRLELDYEFAENMWQSAAAAGWNAGQVHSEVAMLQAARGNLDRAIEYYQVARDGDAQLNRSIVDLWLGYTLIAANRLEEAKLVLANATEYMLDEGAVSVYTHVLHAFVLQLVSDPDADRVLENAWSRFGSDDLHVFAGVLALGGMQDEARSVLAKLDEHYNSGLSTINWSGVTGYLFLGELDHAMVWLERTIENREIRHLSHIKHADYLAPLRAHPRFASALERLAEIESEKSGLQAIVDEHHREVDNLDTY